MRKIEKMLEEILSNQELIMSALKIEKPKKKLKNETDQPTIVRRIIRNPINTKLRL